MLRAWLANWPLDVSDREGSHNHEGQADDGRVSKNYNRGTTFGRPCHRGTSTSLCPSSSLYPPRSAKLVGWILMEAT